MESFVYDDFLLLCVYWTEMYVSLQTNTSSFIMRQFFPLIYM